MNDKWNFIKDIKLKDKLSGHYWRQAGLIGWWMWRGSGPSTQAGISTIMISYIYILLPFIMIYQKRLLSDGFTLSRVVKFASQVLFSMWQHQELREVYRKSGGFLITRSSIFSPWLFSLGWKEADFVTKTVAARNARPNSPTHLNSTLNRPMASQGGTRSDIPNK